MRRIVVPLMAGGILAGFVTSFITAAVELSATILLVVEGIQAPMTYGIYLYMQASPGAGPVPRSACRGGDGGVGTYLRTAGRPRHSATLEHAR